MSQHGIGTLQQTKNHHSFPNRLPPELLSRIFLLYSQDYRAKLDIYCFQYSQKPLHWIRISHVCKHWRMVALNCPLLWTNLDFHHPEFAETMLERSKNAFLQVKFEEGYSCHDPIITQAPTQLFDVLCRPNRLKSVDISTYSTSYLKYPTLLRALGEKAPALESLTLHSAPSSDLDSPAIFTMEGAPSLKHLKLSRFNFQWSNIPLGRTLSTLHLHPYTPHIRPKWDEFLLSLAQIPLMEELELHHTLPRGDVSWPVSLASHLPVKILKLGKLTLEDTTLELSEFFRHVKVPLSSALNLSFDDTAERVATSIESCIDGLTAAWLDNGVPRERRSINILHVDWCLRGRYAAGSRFLIRFGPWPEASNQNSCSESSALLTFRHRNQILLHPFLRSLIGHFDFSKLEEFDAIGNLIPPAVFQATIATLPMKSIRLFEGSLPQFLRALECVDSFGSHSFPALKTITLHGVDFESQSILELLISSLRRRQQIERLEIKEAYHFDAEDAEIIEQALPQLDFIWDTCEMSSAGSEDWD